VTVQTGKVQKQNLASVVSASGEIKPKTYANIGANAIGKIIKLHVKEGDRVKKGSCWRSSRTCSPRPTSMPLALPCRRLKPTPSPPMPR
jgi:HlyD family secretion protein